MTFYNTCIAGIQWLQVRWRAEYWVMWNKQEVRLSETSIRRRISFSLSSGSLWQSGVQLMITVREIGNRKWNKNNNMTRFHFCGRLFLSVFTNNPVIHHAEKVYLKITETHYFENVSRYFESFSNFLKTSFLLELVRMSIKRNISK